MKSDDTIKLYIPKDLIISAEDHPEPYGEKIVVLKNEMWTDVYSDKEGNYYSITNDLKLIKYVNSYKKKMKL